VGRCRDGSRYRASKSRNARARYWHLLTYSIWIGLPLNLVDTVVCCCVGSGRSPDTKFSNSCEGCVIVLVFDRCRESQYRACINLNLDFIGGPIIHVNLQNKSPESRNNFPQNLRNKSSWGRNIWKTTFFVPIIPVLGYRGNRYSGTFFNTRTLHTFQHVLAFPPRPLVVWVLLQ
jgi:hypothetical protein